MGVDLRALVPSPTGIGVYTRELLERLAARGRWDFLGLAHKPLHGEAGLGELPVETGSRVPTGVAWQQLELPRRLAAGDVDLFWSPLQTLPLRSPVPSVVTVHDLTILTLPDTHRFKVRWSQMPFLEKSLERARRVVADSEATADDLLRFFPAPFQRDPDRLRVVYPGVSSDFRPGLGDGDEVAGIRAALTAETGVGCERGYLLYAGTLEPRKNVGAVLSAWEALLDDDPDTALPLVLAGGYGWRSRGIERRIARLRGRHPGRLVHLGRVPRERLLELYRGASVFLFPSWAEGFGLPVAEAMASGVPVVTSDRSSLAEVAGGAALLVRPEAPGELAGAVAKLTAEPDLAAALAAQGLERVSRFSWERAAEAMDEVLGECLAPGAVP